MLKKGKLEVAYPFCILILNEFVPQVIALIQGKFAFLVKAKSAVLLLELMLNTSFEQSNYRLFQLTSNLIALLANHFLTNTGGACNFCCFGHAQILL